MPQSVALNLITVTFLVQTVWWIWWFTNDNDVQKHNANNRIKQWEMPWLLETPPMWLCRSQEPVPVGSVPIVRHTRYQWAILWVGGEPEHRWTRGQSEISADTIGLVTSVVWWGARGIYDKSVCKKDFYLLKRNLMHLTNCYVLLLYVCLG